MKHDSPFLVLPDYRKDLVMELVLGVPIGTIIPDTSSESNDGTKTNVVNRARVGGAKLPSVSFPDANSSVIIPYNSKLRSNSYSIRSYSFWLYVSSDIASMEYIYSQTANFKIQVGKSMGNSFAQIFIFTSEEAEVNAYALNKYEFDVWQMLTFTVDWRSEACVAKLYLGDTLLHTADVDPEWGTNNSVADFVLGNLSGANGATHIDIASARIYESILTIEQIKQIYQYTRRHIIGMSPKE